MTTPIQGFPADPAARCGKTGRYLTDIGCGMVMGVWVTKHAGCGRCPDCIAEKAMQVEIAEAERRARRAAGGGCILLPTSVSAALMEEISAIRQRFQAHS